MIIVKPSLQSEVMSSLTYIYSLPLSLNKTNRFQQVFLSKFNKQRNLNQRLSLSLSLMSDEARDFYYHAQFQEDRYGTGATGFSFSLNNSPLSISNSSPHEPQGFDPSSYMSFTDSLNGSSDYNTLAKAFGLSPSSPEPLLEVKREQNLVVDAGSETAVTPNSSASSSSTEAGDDDSNKVKRERQQKESPDGGESSKKGYVKGDIYDL